MAAPPRLRLTETAPGMYRTWWSVPPDVDPGRYRLRGHLTQAGVTRAVIPLGGLVIRPRAQVPTPVAPTPGPPVAPPPTLPPPPGAPPAPGQVLLPTDYVHQGLRPDIARWVTPDDIIVIGVRNNLPGISVLAAARVWVPGSVGGLDPNAPWPLGSPISSAIPEAYGGTQVTIVPPTDRSLQLTPLALPTGYLVSVAVTSTGATPRRGQVFVSIYLRRGTGSGAVTYWLLAQDYVTADGGPSWPAGRTVGGVEGPGALQNQAIATPAAGAEWSLTVPIAARWRIRYIKVAFTTSIAAGNRFPGLLIKDVVGNETQAVENPNSLGPSVTGAVRYLSGVNNVIVQVVSMYLEIPADLQVPGGAVLQSFTTGLQAGDQYSAGICYTEEWLDG